MPQGNHHCLPCKSPVIKYPRLFVHVWSPSKCFVSGSSTQVGLHTGERWLQAPMLILHHMPWIKFLEGMGLLCHMYVLKSYFLAAKYFTYGNIFIWLLNLLWWSDTVSYDGLILWARQISAQLINKVEELWKKNHDASLEVATYNIFFSRSS